jgi:class 3 adenylate cyclase/tetratricopeptide (TPR) repeat protein
MKCPRCEHENPPDAKVCEECGARLALTCAKCQGEISPSAKFCPECGEPVSLAGAPPRFAAPGAYTPKHLAERILTSRSALEGERKLVTVLFCDIANSTALAERVGPDAMHALLDGFFEIALAEVHRYEGTINQFLGDGFMALFGAPLAHEDHARRAALAALAIPGALRKRSVGVGSDVHGLQVRMGLNTGLVVVGKIGDNLRMDYTAVGDTTNLAARMQQMAVPGQICLTEGTYQAICHYFECDHVGERRVKGKAEPVPVYRLRGARGHVETVRTPSEAGVGASLVGRDGELTAVRERIERLLAGVGAVVSVSGDAGLGKSRLMAEVHRQVATEPLRWLEGRGLSFGQAMSYWPFLEIIRAAVGITETDSEDESWTKLDRRLAALFPDELAEVLPYVATLLGLEVRGALAERVKYLDAQAIGRQIFRTSRRFFERLAQERPLMLVFEDWHWADQSSAALLEHLVPLTETVPLLICWVARPDPDTPATRLSDFVRQKHAEGYIELTLSPLSSAESATLVERLLATPNLPARLRELILRRAEGNPFFMEEVVRSLIAMGAIVREVSTGTWQATADVDQITIPDTIQGIIMARVDRLDDATKQVLKLASVIGRSFFHRVLQAIDEAEQQLDRHLTHLQQLELVREKRRVPELEYIFKHALVQEATYESILADRRRRLHQRVAKSIETLFRDRLDEFSSLLSYHYARAEDWAKAQEYLFRAGDQAGRMAADAEALAHYEHAVAAYARAFGDRWDPLQRAILERKVGEALFRRGEHHRAREYFERALRDLGAPYPTTRWGTRLAIAGQITRQVGHRLLPSLFLRKAAGPAAEERSRIYELMAWIDYFVDQECLILDGLMQLNFSERSGLPVGVVRGSMFLGVVCDQIPLARLAGQYHRRAVVLAEAIQQPVALGLAYLGLALHEHLCLGLADNALGHYRSAATVYREAGDLRGWAAATSLSNGVLRLRGDFGRSLEQSQDLVRAGQDGADHHILAWGLQQFGWTRIHAGALAEAISNLEKAVECFRSIPDYVGIAEATGLLGQSYLRQGKVHQASDVLEQSVELISQRGLRGHATVSTRIGLAVASLSAVEASEGREREKKLNQAKRACRAILKASKTVHDVVPSACRLQGVYEWLRSRPAAAETWWQRSLSAAEKMGGRYELGITYMEMGKRLGSRAFLERAASIFREIDAKVDSGSVHRLLAEQFTRAVAHDEVEGQAVEHFQESIRFLRDSGAENELALACLAYGRLHRRLGRIAEARDYLTRALEIFERLGTLNEPDKVRAELAELPAA